MNKEKCLDKLFYYKEYLTRQQFKTLRGLCLSGNYYACIKGLETILRRENGNKN